MKKSLVKRMIAIALSTVMVSGAMVGCGSNTASKGGTFTSGVGTDEEVELKMYLIGDKPADFDEVYGQVNKIMKEEINATLDVNFISWSDVATKYQLLFQSGENFDLIFTASGWGYYSQVATKNGFLEITEDMLKEYAPTIYEKEPEEAWSQAKIDGKVYMVPNDRNEYGINVFCVRGDLMAKYGIDSIDNYDDLEAYMAAVATGEASNRVKVIANGGGQNLQWPYMLERYSFNKV